MNALELSAGVRLPAGLYFSTALPTIDFETFSPAGYVWNPARQKWDALPGVQPTQKGLFSVGATVYAEHPLADVLVLRYNMRDGRGTQYWRPGMPNPVDLFQHLEAGGLVEGHKVFFERTIWNKVCVRKYGWPELPGAQLRCSLAKARAWGLPGALGNLGKALNLAIQKDTEGQRLIKLLCCPQNPTKKQPKVRLSREDVPHEFDALDRYCGTDVETEMMASAAIPDLDPAEQAFWLVDQEINWRGVAVNRAAIRDCIAVMEQAFTRYNEELQRITGGIKASELQQLKGWLAAHGVHMAAMDEEAISAALQDVWMPDDCRRALEIRSLIGSASVKKLYAMDNQAASDDRLRDLLAYYGARTGRVTGEGPQPLNLPKAGPALRWCENDGCGRPYGAHADGCPWCGTSAAFSRSTKWDAEAVPHVLEIMASRDLDLVEYFYGDAVKAISGCIRGLFVPGPGRDFVCSDYSAIEAVVTAALAGEQWRMEALAAGVDIYLASASRITGTSVEDYKQYKANHGDHHPDRQAIGKPAELGLGFGGWLGAWRQFDDTDRYSDDEVKKLIVAWRDASPAIVEFWGGQTRRVTNPITGRWEFVQEMYGLEGAAIQAVQYPGHEFAHRGIRYVVHNDVLYCTLVSGRRMAYHQPRLAPSDKRPGELQLSFMTENKNPKMGPLGWVRMPTYGGRLCENVVQATARDILRFAIMNLEARGYPVVLHVYDEIVCEIPEGFGSIAELEQIMAFMPSWAQGWPIRAAGGWRGKYYRKG